MSAVNDSTQIQYGRSAHLTNWFILLSGHIGLPGYLFSASWGCTVARFTPQYLLKLH